MEKAISIIVPVYNVEEYIEECIESLIKQDVDNYEIILVDDGSEDASGVICDKYAEKYPFIYSCHKSNGGLGSARNYGMRCAKGKYLLFIDSDDYLKENCLGNMLKITEKYNLDLLLYGCVPFTDDGHLQKNNYPRSDLNYSKVLSGVEGLTQALSVNEYVTSVCMRFMRREFISNSGILFNERYIHEDEDFAFITYIQAERVMNIPDEYYYRRYRNGSIIATRSFNKTYDGYKHAVDSIEAYIAAYKLNKQEIDVCKEYQNILIKILIGLWMNLNKKEREQNKKKIEKLIHNYRNNEKYLNSGIKVLYNNLEIYRRIRKVRTFSKLRKDSCKKALRLVRYETDSVLRIPQYYNKKRKIFLLGTPKHGNVGDHLIAESEKEFIRKYLRNFNCIDCTMMFSIEMLSWIKKHSAKQDIIAISGGGWLGTEWRHNEEFVRNVIYTFPENRIIIFPQTVFYKNDNGYIHSGASIYSSHKNLYFACREQKSYDFINENNFVSDPAHSMLMPDMALFTGLWRKVIKDSDPEQIGLCLREDREISISDDERMNILSTVKAYDKNYVTIETNEQIRVSSNKRNEYILRKMQEFDKVSVLVTDRLHAMILAALTGTPCIAFDNSTHKVMGVYHWLKELEYIKVVDNTSDLAYYIEKFTGGHVKYSFSDWNKQNYLKELAKWFK